MISDKALQEFRDIWLEECGVNISEVDAVKPATDLLTIFDVIYRPITKEELKRQIDSQLLAAKL